MTAPAILYSSRGTGFATASVTHFFAIAGGWNVTNTTESRFQHKFGVAGTLSNLYVTVTTNARTTDTTIKIRNGGADAGTPSAMSVTYTSGQTGTKTDTSNTAAVAVGDLINGSITTSTGTQTIRITAVAVTFTASSGTAVVFAYGDGTGTTLSGTGPITDFVALSGAGTGASTLTEANAQILLPIAGTLSYLTMNVITNSRSTSSTVVTLRKNSGNGNETFTYTASQTGLKTDTSNTDSIVANDLVCVSPALGTGTGNFQFTICGVTFAATNDGNSVFVGASIAAIAYAAATTSNTNLGALLLASGQTEGVAQAEIGQAATLSNLWCFVTANASTTAPALKLRKNAGNGNQNVTITALTTGAFQDTTHTDTVAASDLLNYQITNVTTGAVSISAITMQVRTAFTAKQTVNAQTTPSMSVVKSAGKIVSGQTTPSMSITRQTGKIVNAQTTPSPSVVKSVGKIVGAQTTPSPSMTRSTGKIIGAQTTPSPSCVKSTAKLVSVPVTPAPSVVKSVGKIISVANTPTPSTVTQASEHQVISIDIHPIPSVITVFIPAPGGHGDHLVRIVGAPKLKSQVN